MNARIGLGIASGIISSQSLEYAIRYDQFIVKAITVGMSRQQAEKIFRDEVPRGGDFNNLMQGADLRLDQFLQNGSLPVLLCDVLSPEELTEQPFGAEVVLNGWRWMQSPYGQQFSELDRDKQRGLVLAAIELTRELGGSQQGWPLERALAAVMPHHDAQPGQ